MCGGGTGVGMGAGSRACVVLRPAGGPSDEGAALFLEAVRSKELGLPGYGRPGMFPAEIIVETLSDIEVKENPQSP